MGNVLTAGILGAFAVSAFARILATRRSRSLNEAVAGRLRLHYSATDRNDLATKLTGLPFFSGVTSSRLPRSMVRGGRGVREVMWGEWQGHTVWIFDVIGPSVNDPSIPTGGRGDDPPTMTEQLSRLWDPQKRRTFTCAVVRLNSTSPRVRIVPALLPGRLDHAIDTTTIEFEWGAFNRTYDVYGDDRRFAHAFVDARMMEALMAEKGAYGFQVGGPWLMAYARRQHPSARRAMLDALSRVADAVPRLVG